MSRDSINDFGQLVEGYMRECIDENEEVLKQRAADAGKSAVQQLKQESRKRTGKTAKGWTSTVEADETGVEVTVHDRAYQLTHLLEKEHKIKNQTGKTYGIAPGDHVIESVAESVGQEFAAGGDAM